MPPKKRSYTKVAKSKNDVSKSKNTAKRKHTEASHTLYISNLNSKIKPDKMKENLYILFASFADILEINYPKKNYRGQGWIVVTSSEDADECVTKLEGFNIFDQPIHVKRANKDSKIIEKLNNSKFTEVLKKEE